MANEIKRLHYFTNQFLVEADFTDEQQYHLTMRRRHNKALHTYGVAEGLTVAKTGDKEVTVSSGIAIDNKGQEIVLLDSRAASLSDATKYKAGSDIYITIAYHEEESDPSKATGVTGNTRIKESPDVQAVTTMPPSDGRDICLAYFKLDGTGNVPGNKNDTFSKGPQAAGAVLADSAVTTAKLANSAVTTHKLADGAVTAAKLDGKIPLQKLSMDAPILNAIISTISAKTDHSEVVDSFPSNNPTESYLIVFAYSKTAGAQFHWTQYLQLDSSSPPKVSRYIRFTNETDKEISVTWTVRKLSY